MKSLYRAIAGVVLLAFLAYLGGKFLPAVLSDAPSAPAPQSAAPPPVTRPSTAPATPAASEIPGERSTMADALNSPKTDIRADLRLVSEIVDTFRTNFPRSGNPVGNNAEITAALTGKNSLRLALVPPDHRAINAAGELCDRWGSPFFFHAESASKMEIRSAGPDKKMWTDDDVVFAQ
jgi:hypothetical protein